jgi:hypothetical protein
MSGECCCESARRLQLRTFVTLVDYIVDETRDAGLRVVAIELMVYGRSARNDR